MGREGREDQMGAETGEREMDAVCAALGVPEDARLWETKFDLVL